MPRLLRLFRSISFHAPSRMRATPCATLWRCSRTLGARHGTNRFFPAGSAFASSAEPDRGHFSWARRFASAAPRSRPSSAGAAPGHGRATGAPPLHACRSCSFCRIRCAPWPRRRRDRRPCAWAGGDATANAYWSSARCSPLPGSNRGKSAAPDARAGVRAGRDKVSSQWRANDLAWFSPRRRLPVGVADAAGSGSGTIAMCTALLANRGRNGCAVAPFAL